MPLALLYFMGRKWEIKHALISKCVGGQNFFYKSLIVMNKLLDKPHTFFIRKKDKHFQQFNSEKRFLNFNSLKSLFVLFLFKLVSFQEVETSWIFYTSENKVYMENFNYNCEVGLKIGYCTLFSENSIFFFILVIL